MNKEFNFDVFTNRGLKKDIKNIPAALHSFGIDQQAKSYFVSEGTGFPFAPEEPFRIDFYQYMVCTSGTAQITFNNTDVTIKPDVFFATIPSTIIKVKKHSKNFAAKLLVFDKGFLLKNILDARQLEQLGFFNYDVLPFIQLTKNEADFLKQRLNYIKERNEQASVFKDSIVQSLIFNLLFETAEIFFKYLNIKSNKSISRDEDLFFRFIKLVDAHHLQHTALVFYADQLHISEKYLIQICKNASGKTPGTHIAEANIQEAKLLLNHPDNNISMVANRLNYSSVAAFSKFFKKHTGVSPSAWKA